MVIFHSYVSLPEGSHDPIPTYTDETIFFCLLRKPFPPLTFPIRCCFPRRKGRVHVPVQSDVGHVEGSTCIVGLGFLYPKNHWILVILLKNPSLATIIGCSLLGYPSQKTSMAAFFSLELTWPLGPSGQGDDFPETQFFRWGCGSGHDETEGCSKIPKCVGGYSKGQEQPLERPLKYQFIPGVWWCWWLPSGNQTWLAGKSTINGRIQGTTMDNCGIFQQTTFDFQRVCLDPEWFSVDNWLLQRKRGKPFLTSSLGDDKGSTAQA